MKIDRLLMRKFGRKLLIQKAYFVINVRPSLWMITYENWPIVYEKKWTKNSDTQSIFVINVSLRLWTKSYDKNLKDCLWQNSDENFRYRKHHKFSVKIFLCQLSKFRRENICLRPNFYLKVSFRFYGKLCKILF